MITGPDLVREAADAIRAVVSPDYEDDARAAVLAVLHRLGKECAAGTLWRFVDSQGFEHLARQIEGDT